MIVENILIDAAVVVFTFYIIMRLVQSTIKTCCLLGMMRHLEDAALDFFKNQLPELMKQKHRAEANALSLFDEEDAPSEPCGRGCGCTRPCCVDREMARDVCPEIPAPLTIVKKDD